MSQFSYDQYQEVVNRAQTAPATNAVKIGFFKLKDGEEALVRIKCSSLDDLKFANVHKPVFGKKFEGLGTGYTPVSCLNEVGSYSDTCPFCKAVAAGNETIAKAVKNVYVLMLVAYKDATTGQFSAAIPVVWERPAGFSKELATKLRDYQDLSAHVFKVTRIGSGKDTKYSLDYIPTYDRPELVTADFSAFDNFNINKHSYWEKSAEDLQVYVDTGVFPQPEKAEKQGNLVTDANGIKHGGAPVFANAQEEAEADAALDPKPAPVAQPATPAASTATVDRSKFSF